METLYGQGMDPGPFILAAYSLGALFIGGGGLLILIERRRLRMLLRTLKNT